MAEYSDREAFIPLSRQDLLSLCIQDKAWGSKEKQAFTDFCHVLNAYLHFRYHETLESLKQNFAHLDPDRDTVAIHEIDQQQAKKREQELEKAFIFVLERANFQPLNHQQLQEAMNEESMISLDMKINFDEFEQMQLYWRGASFVTQDADNWWQKFRKQTVTIDVFKRVVLLLRFKDPEYFEAQGVDLKKLRFTPGKMYLYLYKMIPQKDLEILFPNVQIQMTWKDRLFFIVPALGAAIPMILKALPQLLLIVGVVLFFTLGPGSATKMGISGEQVQNFLPVIAALLSMGMVFGSFAFKQYLNYKNKRLKFMKDVTDTLFFQNLVSNSGVFHSLVDAAEEEESKEIILAVYFLLKANTALSAVDLDNQIETWLEKHGQHVDFDIHKALNTLMGIKKGSQSLLEANNGTYQFTSLNKACTLLDEIWDNIFEYNQNSQELV